MAKGTMKPPIKPIINPGKTKTFHGKRMQTRGQKFTHKHKMSKHNKPIKLAAIAGSTSESIAATVEGGKTARAYAGEKQMQDMMNIVLGQNTSGSAETAGDSETGTKTHDRIGYPGFGG